MVNCPQCNAVIDVEEDELDEGDALTCEECGTNLSVDSTSPLELLPEDEADAEEDDDLDEDDDEDDDDEDLDEDEEDDDED